MEMCIKNINFSLCINQISFIFDQNKCVMKFDKEKIDAWFESEEGKKSIDNWILKCEKEEVQSKRNFDRVCRIINNMGLEVFIEKCTTWYDSDRYVLREYKCGYQPRETLLYYLVQYFEKFGLRTSNNTNMFMEYTHEIGDYYIGIMYGQGTAIKIGKI